MATDMALRSAKLSDVPSVIITTALIKKIRLKSLV